MCEIVNKIRQEGIIAGKNEAILELLKELGNIPKQLIQRICWESNSDILNEWLKCAVKTSTLAEFKTKIELR